jgi:hypothetical protein
MSILIEQNKCARKKFIEKAGFSNVEQPGFSVNNVTKPGFFILYRFNV